MANLLEEMKYGINPKDVDGGVMVYALGGHIPLLHPGAWASYSKKGVVGGGSILEVGSHFREGSQIINSYLGKFACVQDDVILVNSKIGDWATMAHGAHAINTLAGFMAHFNIAASTINCRLEDMAFLMAGCDISGHADGTPMIVPGNMCLYRNKRFGSYKARPKGVLDSNLKHVDGTALKIFFEPGDDLAMVSRLITMQRDAYSQFMNSGALDRETLLTLANWISNYPGLQVHDQVMMMNEYRRQIGDIVFYDPHIKTDALLFAYCSLIFERISHGRLAQESLDMARAFAFISSSHTPAGVAEMERINGGMARVKNVLQNITGVIGSIRDDVIIRCPAEEEVKDIFRPKDVEKKDCRLPPERMKGIIERLDFTAQRIEEIERSKVSPVINLKTDAVRKAEELKRGWNRTGASLPFVEGGTLVLAHDIYVPKINLKAKFYDCVLRGVITVDGGSFDGAMIVNKRFHIETQMRIHEDVVLQHASCDTAHNETETCTLKNMVAVGKETCKVFIHGADIGSEGATYIASSVIGDGAKLSGVVLPEGVDQGQNMEGWWYIMPSRDMSGRIKPEDAVNNAEFMVMWAETPFGKAGILPTDIEAVKNKSRELREQKAQEIDAKITRKVQEHGIAFLYSPHLQQAAHDLYLGAKTLEACGNSNSVALSHINEMLEFVIGLRKEVSAPAAAGFEKLMQDENYLGNAIGSLFEVARHFSLNHRNVTLNIPVIDAVYEHNPIFSRTEKHITESLQPKNDISGRKFDLLKSQTETAKPVQMTPEGIVNVISTIQQIPELLSHIRRHALEMDSQVVVNLKGRVNTR